MKLIGQGTKERPLAREAIGEIVDNGLTALGVQGKRVLAIVPDNTRSFEPVGGASPLAGCRARHTRCDLLIANGTHAVMGEDKIDQFLDRHSAPDLFRDCFVYNHRTGPRSCPRSALSMRRRCRSCPAGAWSGRWRSRSTSGSSSTTWLVIIGPVFPARSGGHERRLEVLLPRYLRRRGDQPVALARGADRHSRYHRPFGDARPADGREGRGDGGEAGGRSPA